MQRGAQLCRSNVSRFMLTWTERVIIVVGVVVVVVVDVRVFVNEPHPWGSLGTWTNTRTGACTHARLVGAFSESFFVKILTQQAWRNRHVCN